MPKWIKAKPQCDVESLVIYDANQLSLPKTLTAEQYSQHEHILVSFSGIRKGMVDKALEEIGLQRRIAVAVSRIAGLETLYTSLLISRIE